MSIAFWQYKEYERPLLTRVRMGNEFLDKGEIWDGLSEFEKQHYGRWKTLLPLFNLEYDVCPYSCTHGFTNEGQAGLIRKWLNTEIALENQYEENSKKM